MTGVLHDTDNVALYHILFVKSMTLYLLHFVLISGYRNVELTIWYLAQLIFVYWLSKVTF